jgi:hypothetical protein
MQSLTLDLPSMYGDHHVTEVRRILLELAGIQDIFASSSFHTVEITYDPDQIVPETIETRLAEAGYLDPITVPLETDQSAYQQGGAVHFRHTAAYAQTGQVVSFAQVINYAGRPLWPCPGMGPIAAPEEEE